MSVKANEALPAARVARECGVKSEGELPRAQARPRRNKWVRETLGCTAVWNR